MRISQLVSSHFPTHPLSSHAINSHVAWLTNILVQRGQTVDLFASSESETKANLHASTPALSTLGLSESFVRHYIMAHIADCYRFAQVKSDIVHSHFNLLSSFIGSVAQVPTVTSIHTPIKEDLKPLLMRFKNERYISFSLAQRTQMPELNWCANIYHGIDTTLFAYQEIPEDYFLFLGRITEEKGLHFAIQAAKEAGVKLVIAGASYAQEGYWQKNIELYINGTDVKYVGLVPFEKKIAFLQNAKALLFPTQAQEIFGYAMIEAMSCGTPVIGWDNGSVREIVKDGITGFVVESISEMVEAIRSINIIDRKNVRNRAECYFSVEKMVKGYEKVYRRVLEDEVFKKGKDGAVSCGQ